MIHLWQTQNQLTSLCVLTTTPTEGDGHEDLGFLQPSKETTSVQPRSFYEHYPVSLSQSMTHLLVQIIDKEVVILIIMFVSTWVQGKQKLLYLCFVVMLYGC